MEAAVARIERLERNNRRMTVVLLALIALFGASVSIVHSADASLRAASLTIVDSQGRQRILLGAVAQASVIVLNDKNDRPRIGVLASNEKSALRLFDRTGSDIASLQNGNEDTALAFAGRNASALLGTVGVSPGMSLADKHGAIKLSMPEGSSPSLIATDSNDKQRVSFGQSQSGDFIGFIAGQSADTSDYSMP